MQIGKTIIKLMAVNDGPVRFWLDARVGRFWYVAHWIRGEGLCVYRSTDATPPRDQHHGRTYIGTPTSST